MNFCPNCGSPLDEGVASCPVCGMKTLEGEAPRTSASASNDLVNDDMDATLSAFDSFGPQATNNGVSHGNQNPYQNQGTQNYNTQNYGTQNMNYGSANYGAQNPNVNYGSANYGAQGYGNVSQVAAPVSGGATEEQSKKCLTMGIVGLCLSVSVIASIAGIIVSAIALNRGSQLMQQLNVTRLSGKAKVGHILAKAGLFSGIGFTVYLILVLCMNL